MAKVPIIPQVQMQMSDGVSLPAPEVRPFQDTSNQAQQALAQGLGSLGQSLGRAGYAMHTQELAKREEEERLAAAQAKAQQKQRDEMQKLRDKYDETVALDSLNAFKVNQSGLIAGFKAKKGLAAVDAIQAFASDIQEQLKKEGEKLQPGAQQHLFAKGASTYLTEVLIDANAHAASEGVAANVAANETRVKDLGSILSDGIVARVGSGGDLNEQDIASFSNVVAGIADHSKAVAEAKGIADKDEYARNSVSAAVASALKNSIPALYDDETGEKERRLVSILDTATSAKLIGATEETALRQAIDKAVGQVSGGTSGRGRRRGEPTPNQMWKRFLESTPAVYSVPATIDAFESAIDKEVATGGMTNDSYKEHLEYIASLRKATKSDYESGVSKLVVLGFSIVQKARADGDTASSPTEILSRNPEMLQLAADLDSRGLKDGIALSDVNDRVGKLELPGVKGEDNEELLSTLRSMTDAGWKEIASRVPFDVWKKGNSGMLTEETLESFRYKFSPKQLTETQRDVWNSRIKPKAEALIDSGDIEKPDGSTRDDVLRAVENAFHAQVPFGEDITQDQYKAIESSVLSTSLFGGKKYFNVAPKKEASPDAFYVTDRDGKAYRVGQVEDEKFGDLVDIINNLRKPFVVVHSGKPEHFETRGAADMYANYVGARVVVADTSDLPDVNDQQAVLRWAIKNQSISKITPDDLVKSSEIRRLRRLRAVHNESDIVGLLQKINSAKDDEVVISERSASMLRDMTPKADDYMQETWSQVGKRPSSLITIRNKSGLIDSIRIYNADLFTSDGHIRKDSSK